ncbi:MAG: type II secretion system ATPase GspE [Cellvibrionales bacterium]|jgi:general secretion pathway protein E|nr:type II secretion system ATPase GspE [Cellvibrionales bacterium]HRG49460.1 type II secretion system ATPase GspE [Pseudomonadales bacterium]
MQDTLDQNDVAQDNAADQVSDAESVVRRLPFGFSKRFGVLVVPGTSNPVELLYREDASMQSLLEARRVVAQPVAFKKTDVESFNAQLARAHENNSGEAMQMVEDLGDELDLTSLADSVPDTSDLLEQEDDAPIIRLINALLTEAVKQNASDIHIETFEKRLIVRLRTDGILREVVQPKRALAPLLVSRIKVMAKLDIAEKRVPQDGRISLRVAGREVDIRVSTMPSSNGERVVLRLLDKRAGRLDLNVLGMQPRDLALFSELLRKPHGIILVTGPTGSGKTTSLYAGLSSINDATKNILTVEDPIEYNLEGIGQTQVNTKADMTFARGLRAMLRQDPDVVMVGEIRDLETAEIAVQASLTGHLVLSTLHTNTAIGAVTRLVDMGVEPFLLSSSLVGLLAQRLVRVLCPHCKEAHQPDEAECELLQVDKKNPPTIYHAIGCAHCKQLGYLGRTGVYELIAVDDKMRELIHSRVSEAELTAYARTKGPSIRDDGRARILAGETTVEEVLRVTQEE